MQALSAWPHLLLAVHLPSSEGLKLEACVAFADCEENS